MKYTCISCQSELLVSDSEPNKQIVFCQRCEKKGLLTQPTPERVELREEKDALTIIYRAPRRDIGYLMSLLVMFVVLIVWLAQKPWDVLLVLVGVLFGIFAGIFVFVIIAVLFERSRLRFLRTPEAPSGDPFRGEGSAPRPTTIEIYQSSIRQKRDVVLVESLKQLYCVRGVNDNSATVYHIEAILKSGLVVPLVKNIGELKTAQYIEAKIESFLQIEDESVPEEAK